MAVLTFDEPTHLYRLDGEVIPSVSNIIAPLKDFSGIPAAVLKKAQDRGKAVHKACELYDLGLLDNLGPDAAVLQPYLDAWVNFLATERWEWTAIEQMTHHPKLRYAGTPDRVGLRNGERVGVDIKATAAESAATGVQLGGYELFEAEPWTARLGVRLLKTGKFQITEYPDERVMFRSLVNVYQWRQRHE